MAKTKREHGQGGLFRHKNCKRWMVQYYTLDGRCIRESTGLTDRVAAQQVLNQRLAAVARGEIVERVKPRTVQQLWENMVQDYKVQEKHRCVRDVGDCSDATKPQGHWQHIGPVFGTMAATRLGTLDLQRYLQQRRAAGAAKSTVNKELGALKHAYKLAHGSTPRLLPATFMLVFPKRLDTSDNVKQGFVEPTQYSRMAQHATSLWLRTFLEIGFTYGWREGEMLRMQVHQANFAENELYLLPGTTKNKDARRVEMTPTVRQLLEQCCAGKQATQRVLTRDGKPVIELRGEWRAMCCAAGLGHYLCKRCGHKVTTLAHCPQCNMAHRQWKYVGITPHDLRRSAAKQMRLAGVPDSSIKDTGGWKTTAVMHRYQIGDKRDRLQVVARLLAAREDAISGQPVVIPSKEGLAAMPVKTTKPA